MHNIEIFIFAHTTIQTMRKHILLAVIALALTLAACSGKSAQKGQSGKEKSISMVKELDYNIFLKDVWDLRESPNSIVLKSDKPCVIDFYTTWCGPCKKIAPIMDTLSNEYEGKVLFYKVDVDKERELGMAFKIEQIPTIIMIATDGTAVRKVGALNKENYISLISKHLNP